jgi:hypothetical protein
MAISSSELSEFLSVGTSPATSRFVVRDLDVGKGYVLVSIDIVDARDICQELSLSFMIYLSGLIAGAS